MIFLTGASGFIGQYVFRLLKKRGEKIRILLPESEKDKAGQFSGADILPGELNDENVIEEGMKGCRAVVHLAGKNIDTDGSGFQKINVEGTRNLCRKAAEAGAGIFIYLSSVGVYGHHRHFNADESLPVQPDTAFSRSKADAEQIVLDHHRAGDFQGVVLRHRFVYGEGDRHVIARMIRAARKYPFLISRGRATVSMILVDDLAEIISRMINSPPDGDSPVYHVTDGEPVRYRDIIYTLCQAYGFKPPRFSIPFALLYYPLLIKEKITGSDPETAASSLSSIRIMLVGVHNSFSNTKLIQRYPDLKLQPFKTAFGQLKTYYQQFAEE